LESGGHVTDDERRLRELDDLPQLVGDHARRERLGSCPDLPGRPAGDQEAVVTGQADADDVTLLDPSRFERPCPPVAAPVELTPGERRLGVRDDGPLRLGSRELGEARRKGDHAENGAGNLPTRPTASYTGFTKSSCAPTQVVAGRGRRTASAPRRGC